MIEKNKTLDLNEDELDEGNLKHPIAIVCLKDNIYGIASEFIEGMVPIPHVFAVPDMPDYFRGMVNIRDRVIPLMDLRRRLGKISQLQEIQEFIEMLGKREEDHRKWLNELEVSVVENRVFTLTTNPHSCAFGKWYDSFKTDNITINKIFKKFDTPHKKIHSIAEHIEKLKKDNQFNEAKALIEKVRKTELRLMIDLFKNLKQALVEENNEIVITLNVHDKIFAIVVDSVIGVEYLEEIDQTDLSNNHSILTTQQFIEGIKIHKQTNQMVLLLNVENLYS